MNEMIGNEILRIACQFRFRYYFDQLRHLLRVYQVGQDDRGDFRSCKCAFEYKADTESSICELPVARYFRIGGRRTSDVRWESLLVKEILGR